MTILTTEAGGIGINGRFYEAGLLEMRPFGQSDDRVLITYAVDGYVFQGIHRFDDYTIDGDVPEDRAELLSWAANTFSQCSGGSITPLTAPAFGTITAGDGQISADLDPVTGATSYTVTASADNFATVAGTATAANASSPFVIAGLTNGTDYKLKARVTGAGHTPASTTTSGTYTPAAVVAPPNNVEWVSVSSDPYTGLLSADALTYTGSAALSSTSANAVIDVHSHPDNQYLVIRYPVANTQKNKWDESGTANVNVAIPGIQFPHAFDARGYHYIVSDSVVFNPDPSARVTLHT